MPPFSPEPPSPPPRRDLVEASIGMLRTQARRLPEAEVILRAVLKRDPLLSGALYNLACVRARGGLIDDLIASPLRHCGTY